MRPRPPDPASDLAVDAGGIPPRCLTLSIGPGWHHPYLIREMSRRHVLRRAIHSWPEFRVDDYGDPSEEGRLAVRLGFYRHLVRVTWGIWRRIPLLKAHETPQVWLSALYDRLAARYTGGGRLFHGWSQVSLASMKAAQSCGAAAVLEHPMVHAAVRESLMRREYSRQGGKSGSYYGLFSTAMRRRMEREYDRADMIVVPSRFCERSFLERGIPPARLARVPLGVDAGSFPLRTSAPQGPFRVLYAGRLELLKGLEYLLRAWGELRLRNSELWLVGRLFPEALPLLERHADPSIRVRGEVSQSELCALYQAADVVVFPSLCDAFGLVILEAMACGAPVIASESSGGPDVIRDGENGCLVPPGDERALGAALLGFFENRGSAVEMGRRAAETVRRSHSWHAYAGNLLRVYRGLLP